MYALRFVVLAADAQVARSILLYQSNVDKISHLAEDKALACAGPQSDCVSFTEYVSKNMALYELNNDVKLTTKAAATFIRGEVRESLYTVRVSLTLACVLFCVCDNLYKSLHCTNGVSEHHSGPLCEVRCCCGVCCDNAERVWGVVARSGGDMSSMLLNCGALARSGSDELLCMLSSPAYDLL